MSVRQVDGEGVVIETFESLQVAADRFCPKCEYKARYKSAKVNIYRAATGKSDSAFGYGWDFEDQDRRRAAHEARAARLASAIPRCRPVTSFDLTTGALLKQYDSGKAAQEDTGADAGHISQCAQGLRNEAGGRAWAFAD